MPMFLISEVAAQSGSEPGLVGAALSAVVLVAHLDHQRNLPVELIDGETVERFGMAARAALRNQDNREFVRAIVSDVTVTDDEVQIEGPKAALAQQTATFASTGKLVPSFAQEWRAMSDKTENWRMALSY